MAARGRRKPSERDVMEHERFDALKELAESIGWEVTVSRSLEGRGGACLVRGRHRVIVSRRVHMADRIEVLLDALREADFAQVFVRPDLRELLERPADTAASEAG